LFAIVLAGCSSPAEVVPDAPGGDDAAIDAAADATFEGFGELSGMCGVLMESNLVSASPLLVQADFTFARAYVDPADRALLTLGGMHMIDTPNAGGHSELSELFAFEQLARCEMAGLVKTETEIAYQNQAGKKTDILVELDGHKIGVSVTRAFAYPIGMTYSEAQATELLTRKLGDIKLSSANVAPADAWDKQILAYMAIDDQAAQMVVSVWNGLDAQTKADTILLITTTSGDDLFIYQE
jgi:hypothetical protein